MSLWQLKSPIDTVIFDCDSTLSRIEGIDELAQNANIKATVSALTDYAMTQAGMNPAIYAQR